MANDPGSLRWQAARFLRMADAAGDHESKQAFTAQAAWMVERAVELETQARARGGYVPPACDPPAVAQQQQQIQPKRDEE